jgi:hypothetical protein
MNSVKALHLHAMVRFDQKKGAEFPFTFLFTQSKKGVLLHGLEQYSRVFFVGQKKRETRKSRFSDWAGFSSYRSKFSAFLNFPTQPGPNKLHTHTLTLSSTSVHHRTAPRPPTPARCNPLPPHAAAARPTPHPHTVAARPHLRGRLASPSAPLASPAQAQRGARRGAAAQDLFAGFIVGDFFRELEPVRFSTSSPQPMWPPMFRMVSKVPYGMCIEI